MQTCRGAEKVGVLGFCMGGALSAAAAVLVEEIDASVVFYGTPKPELAKMQGSCPLRSDMHVHVATTTLQGLVNRLD